MHAGISPGNRLIGRAEVAEIFGVSPSTVTRWADAGKLPAIKTLGGHRRYDAEAVMQLAHEFLKETTQMEEITFGVPTMYADHHVLAVRQALLQLDGVDEVQASSAFKTVRVSFDASQTTTQQIAMALVDAGYAPAGLGGDGNGTVPVSMGKKDPAWAGLNMRTVETHPAEIGAVR